MRHIKKKSSYWNPLHRKCKAGNFEGQLGYTYIQFLRVPHFLLLLPFGSLKVQKEARVGSNSAQQRIYFLKRKLSSLVFFFNRLPQLARQLSTLGGGGGGVGNNVERDLLPEALHPPSDFEASVFHLQHSSRGNFSGKIDCLSVFPFRNLAVHKFQQEPLGWNELRSFPLPPPPNHLVVQHSNNVTSSLPRVWLSINTDCMVS